MISPTQPYPQSQVLCLLHPLWGERVIMFKFCDVMMVLVIVIKMMSIYDVDTWEQWWWLPMRSHSTPPSPWSGWTGTPEVFLRWRWWCWKYFRDGQDYVQYFASVMNRDICHGRNHPMTSSQKMFFFHLLTIRRSAKAVFCDRRHLLKFSLQQDLWTKIITISYFRVSVSAREPRSRY